MSVHVNSVATHLDPMLGLPIQVGRYYTALHDTRGTLPCTALYCKDLYNTIAHDTSVKSEIVITF